MSRRIGLYGGTFNPPHTGHVRVAASAAELLRLDRLLVMPSHMPPHKPLPPGTPNAAKRLEMTRIAMRDIARCEVSDYELQRAGVSYTADTARLLHKMYPGAELVLIVGTDMFLSLHSWVQPEEIMNLMQVAVFARELGGQGEIERQRLFLEERFGARIIVAGLEPLVVSSTELREAMAGGSAGQYLPESVWDYICRENLYGVNATMEKSK